MYIYISNLKLFELGIYSHGFTVKRRYNLSFVIMIFLEGLVSLSGLKELSTSYKVEYMINQR